LETQQCCRDLVVGYSRDDQLRPVLCIIYRLIVPTRPGMAPFLEMVLPAFKWLTFWGFWLGLTESFLYGAFLGLVFVPVYNLLNRQTLPVSC